MITISLPFIIWTFWSDPWFGYWSGTNTGIGLSTNFRYWLCRGGSVMVYNEIAFVVISVCVLVVLNEGPTLVGDVLFWRVCNGCGLT